METLKCNVVMLPTQSKSEIMKHERYWAMSHYPTQKGRWKNDEPPKTWTFYHLYFTSARKIQVGDWFLWWSQQGYVEVYQMESDAGYGIRTHTKLRDGNVIVNWSQSKKVEATTDSSLSLPSIPPSFVEKYVQVQGKINEVLLQLDLKNDVHTRLDGSCIVHKVKDSWNREELEEACWAAFVEVHSDFITEQQRENFKTWFNENY